MAQFISAGTVDELKPGEGKLLEVDGKSIALFNVAGSVYAIDNTCLHEGGPLCEGFLQDEIVTCPWHQWQYNLRTGESLEDSMLKLETYPVRIADGKIEVEI